MRGSQPVWSVAAASAVALALWGYPGVRAQAQAPTATSGPTAPSAPVAPGAPSAIVDGPPIKWQFSVSGRARPYTKGIEYISKYVSDRSGGKFRIDIGYRGRFSPERENLEALRVGAIEGAAMCIYAQPQRTPAATALDLPFLPIAGFEQTRAVQEAFFAQPFAISELAHWNSRFLLAAVMPQHEVMGIGTPPLAIKDWKGKRVRALGNVARGLEALGATPVEGSLGGIANAMKAGTVDAVALPFSYSHVGYAIPRAAKWFTENLSPGTINCPFIVAIKAWDRLPAQYRQLIDEARPGAYAATQEVYRQFDDQAREDFAKAGIVGVRYSAADLAAIRDIAGKPYWDAWVKEMDAKGVPARQLLDLIFATAAKKPPR